MPQSPSLARCVPETPSPLSCALPSPTRLFGEKRKGMRRGEREKVDTLPRSRLPLSFFSLPFHIHFKPRGSDTQTPSPPVPALWRRSSPLLSFDYPYGHSVPHGGFGQPYFILFFPSPKQATSPVAALLGQPGVIVPCPA